MQYVIIGFGFKEVFTADNPTEAVAQAYSIAHRERLDVWLLYNRLGDLIFDCSGGCGI